MSPVFRLHHFCALGRGLAPPALTCRFEKRRQVVPCARRTSSDLQTEAGSLINTIRMSVSLRADICTQIEQARGVSRGSVLRDAIDAFIARTTANSDGADISHLNLSRIALLCEFSQASADVLLREIAPDKRGQVIQTVTERMEQYHGQK